MTNTVVADSNRDSMGSNLRLDLSWGHLHALDHRDMGYGTSSSKTIGKSSIRKTTIEKLRVSLGLTLADVVTKGQTITVGTNNRSGRGYNGRGNHRADRGVVDEGGGGGEDLGGASKDGWVGISGPLADIVTGETVAKAVVADSDRDSVGGDLRLNLSWALHHAFDYRHMGYGTSSSKAKDWGSIGETTIEKLRVSLWCSQGHGSQGSKKH